MWGKPKKKRRGETHGRRLICMTLMFAGAVAMFAGVMLHMEQQLVERRVQESAYNVLHVAESRYEDALNRSEAAAAAQTEDRTGDVGAAALFLNTCGQDAAAVFEGLAAHTDQGALYLLGPTGRVLQKPAGADAPAAGAETLRTLAQGAATARENEYDYYAAPCDAGTLILQTPVDPESAVRDTDVLGTILDETHYEGDGFVFAIDRRDNTFCYFPYMPLNSADISLGGITADTFWDGLVGWQVVDGVSYCCSALLVDDYMLVAALPRASVMRSVATAVAVPVLVFVLVTATVLLYAGILLTDRKLAAKPKEYLRLGKRFFLNKTFLQAILPLSCAGLVLLCGISFYAQTLFSLSRQAIRSNQKLTAITASLDEGKEQAEKLQTDFDTACRSQVRMVAWMLANDPALAETENLRSLAKVLSMDAIYVFDENGRAVATSTDYINYSLSDTPGDPSYGFWALIRGDVDDLVVDASAGGSENAVSLAGTRRLDAVGVVRLSVPNALLNRQLQAAGLSDILREADAGTDAFAFAMEAGTGQILAAPVERWVGTAAEEHGMTAGVLSDGYAGYQTMDNVSYFINGTCYDDCYLYTAVAAQAITRGRSVAVGATLAASLLTMLLMVLMTTLRLGAPPRPRPAAPEEEPTMVEVTMPNGEVRRVSAAYSRWQRHTRHWDERKPEQKFRSVVSAAFAVAVIATASYSFFINSSYDPDSIMDYISSGHWERGINIFSLTDIAMIFSVVLVFSWVARWLIVQITRALGQRGETIGRLLDSFIKYAALIGTAFYCLNLIGINTGTLMASAGILSAVLGFGAQNVIGDILAGVFIVFEGEFRVGDIVMMGDWRGTVLEIGIRTTKVEDVNRNIKIFNNSTLSGVINMTKEFSFAICDVQTEYGASLEHVEAILKEELPKIRQRLPKITYGPYYGGVTELGASGVTLRILAQCREEDRIMLTRELNRELKLTFDRSGISVPFPQVVVHQGHTSAAELIPTERERELARQLVEEGERGAIDGSEGELN